MPAPLVMGRSLKASLASIVPTWLANMPGARDLYSFCFVLAALGDTLREIALQGQFAAYPGVGPPDSYTLAAQSRGLIQGPAESDALFAVRLIDFRDAHARDGSPEGLALEIQAYLVGFGTLGSGVYPVVRVIDRAGNAITANADQSITASIVSWNWDEVGGWVDSVGFNPPARVDTWWTDLWVLVQSPFVQYTSDTDPNWLSAFDSGDQTLDSLCPQAVVSDILTIVSTVGSPANYVRQIVFCANPATFAPSGTFGNAYYERPSDGAGIVTRDLTACYWEPLGGV